MIIYSSVTAGIIARLKTDLPQGMLLRGPSGIGLTTAAKDIARAHSKEVIVVEPDEKGTIGIDVIRNLYTVGRSKGTSTIIIIDQADAMGREAQNALLKLLEEPVASLRFILTSHSGEQLLPTILSRVAAYVITRLSHEQSLTLLDDLKVSDPTQRAQMLFIADGLPAAMTRYAGTPKLFTMRSLVIRDARTFLQGTREDRLLLSSKYKDRSEALGLLADMMALLRRGIEAGPKPDSADTLDTLLDAEAALNENASVRLTLTQLSLAL